MIIGQVDKEGAARDRPLEGLKIVVNAGNGMGGFLADTLTEVRNGFGSWMFPARVSNVLDCPLPASASRSNLNRSSGYCR